MTRLLAGLFVMGTLAWLQAPAPLTQADTAFKYAYAYHSCAPWDGPAIEVTLRKSAIGLPNGQRPGQAYPQVNIALWTGEPPIKRWIEIPGTNIVGYLGFCTGENQCKPAAGRVWLTRLTADRIEGEARIRLPGEPERTFRFAAPLSHGSPGCG